MKILTKDLILKFLKTNKLMAVATHGDFPWIATVYYTFDKNLNLYFLSSPTTLHCQQITKNNKVAISIADSHQDIKHKPKIGLQLSGTAEQISNITKVKYAVNLWKKSLGVTNSKISYANMAKKVITGRMYKISPKRIKIFGLFKTEEGQEPVLEL
ncbi:pyridoxamine 5'-phosphate oxidase family protein [Candidatus Gottesmanbacteria bacterium]|nr:pyridoxamine 5'-phosphate oxidase family protein [Candidatus Gottesmanbacteria bacterium]